jgi:hypothetical protein
MSQVADRSMRELLADLAGDVSTLFRKEIELARAEAGEQAGRALSAIGGIAAGMVIGLAALIVLLQALVIGLTNAGLPAGWSALIVGLLVAIVAYVMVQKGVNDLKARNLMPERTVRSVREDARTVKEHVQ